MAERKPSEYYNTQKLWYPKGKEPLLEERFYSDPNVEKGIVPALKSLANAPRELKEMKMEYYKSKDKDAFGFGIQDKSPAVRQHEIMVKDHINAWNRLVENKSPLGIQQDDLNWQPRFEQLMGDDSFRNFLKTDNMKDKITILRDSGLGPNKDMSDQELAQFLMTHVPSGLTEDPNVSEEAKERNNPYGNIPYISNALKRRDDAMNPEGY